MRLYLTIQAQSELDAALFLAVVAAVASVVLLWGGGTPFFGMRILGLLWLGLLASPTVYMVVCGIRHRVWSSEYN
jgi:hypothetical protein